MKLKILLVISFFFVFLILFFNNSVGSTVHAQSASSACSSIGGTYSNNVCNFSGTSSVPTSCSSINSTITTVITLLFSLAGLLFFIMIVVSGIKIITAGGDTEKISSAKKGIINAIIGLVIVIGAFLIIEVITSLLGVSGSLFYSNPISSNCSISAS